MHVAVVQATWDQPNKQSQSLLHPTNIIMNATIEKITLKMNIIV
jgi:hypothetical protein